jgi:hypothetical protein
MVMKLKGMSLVAVAMMVGSLAVAGCKQDDPGVETPEENPDTAPVVEAATTAAAAAANAAAPGTETDAFVGRYWAPHAPPAVRIEERGVARPGHFWAPGYYRWTGREHVWYGGRWIANREGYGWNGPRWEPRGGRYYYRPGYWHRR